MLETIVNFLGKIALYAAVLLGVVVLYFLWVAFREWRAGQRAAFGVERDMASSEMVGALLRAAGVLVVAVLFFGIGQIDTGDEPSGESSVEPTRPPIATISAFSTATPSQGTSIPPFVATNTPQAAVTDLPQLPPAATATAAVQPTPEMLTVIIFGGIWLRDAPNGGTINVLPQGTVVELQEGREAAGNFEWQKVVVASTPAGSEALVGLEGWVAYSPEFLDIAQ
jgi:hypothetical protein